MLYTIKEIADLAGETTRTLRYYDEIGLLRPAGTGVNSYRYYDQESLLHLQQILFFRELQVPLKQVREILCHPGFNLLDALEDHRLAIQKKAERLEQLLATIEHTIDTIKGETSMSAEDYFQGFDETQYEEEVQQRWGHTPQYTESQKKWTSYSKDQREAIKAAGGDLTIRMVGSDPQLSADDPDVQAAVGEYFDYLNRYFYTCDLDFLRNLADMWVQDPRFAVNYERIRPGGAEFVRQAVHVYCDWHS
jgi:DNA-binding transcriptional MerR regulator